MAKDTVTRKVECQGYDDVRCGNTIYEKTYAWDADVANPKPIWRCTNCYTETPRKGRMRRSNRMRALDAWKEIRDAWAPTTDALKALADAGTIKYGAYLLHNHFDNFHLGKLIDTAKPSNFDVNYHTAKAWQDLADARKFVEENNGKQ